MFLFAMLSIVVCAMMATAIMGTVIIALVLVFLFTLLAVGAHSTSVAMGLYKRSCAAGFKSFLVIVFVVICAGLGFTEAQIAGSLFELPVPTASAALTGVVGGSLEGWLMALATYQTIQLVFHYLSKRLRFNK